MRARCYNLSPDKELGPLKIHDSKKQPEGRILDNTIISDTFDRSVTSRFKRDHSHLSATIRNGLSQGCVQLSPMSFRWDISGNCVNGFQQELYAAPPPSDKDGYAAVGKKTKHSLRLFMITRCRKCENCIKYRSRLWAGRAHRETLASPRTWLCTFTLRPEVQQLVLDRCRLKYHADFDTLETDEQFALRVQEIQPAFTKMLKRIRKNSGATFKYIIVAEPHKSGAPHFHALMHEKSMDTPLRWAHIHDQWRLGFSHVKLVKDAKTSYYVTKYISKSLKARVRASINYGGSEDAFQPLGTPLDRFICSRQNIDLTGSQESSELTVQQQLDRRFRDAISVSGISSESSTGRSGLSEERSGGE